MSAERVYIAIDLKSFYASVECVERGLDPLKVNLVVADLERTEKTICLAVSPALKAYGISGRARLFEAIERVNEVNANRKRHAPHHEFSGKSYFDEKLKSDPSLAVDFIVATPHMQKYLDVSAKIVSIYLSFVAPEDMHVYSIDEVFLDVTQYLSYYRLSAKELAMKIILKVFSETGITATAGIAENLYLAKVAMDIVAKHVPPDENGVRIAELSENTYRKLLWAHEPITDFWRVGRGYEKRLKEHGMTTMGDVARCSLENEDLLYSIFGVNAELLIDHAWGWEPCTIKDIKAYRPHENSICSGQVLMEPYPYEKGLLVLKEMAISLAMEIRDKRLLTQKITLTVSYDRENLTIPERVKKYMGEIAVDHYGRIVPKPAHGTASLKEYTCSAVEIKECAAKLYERLVDKNLTVRRLNLTFLALQSMDENAPKQLDLFDKVDPPDPKKEKEKKIEETMLTLQKKFGKRALLKGINLEDGATDIERGGTIGGHRK